MSEKIGEIFKLIPQASKMIGAVAKTGENVDQNYKFRAIDDVYNAIQPVFSELGIFPVPEILENVEQVFETETNYQNQKKVKRSYRVKLKIKYKWYAADGSSFETIVYGEGIDSSDKATNKAMTAAYKYMLIQVFSLAVAGTDDADLTTPETETTKSKPPAYLSYKMKLKTKGNDQGKLLSEIGFDKLLAMLDYLDAENKKRKLTPDEIEFGNFANDFVSANSGNNPPPLNNKDEIPF